MRTPQRLRVATCARLRTRRFTADWAGHRRSLFEVLEARELLAGTAATYAGADIGSVGLAGSDSLNNGAFTVTGGGADIWGDADAFHFVSQAGTGDVTVVAQVMGQTNTDSWAKAGVMIRQSRARRTPRSPTWS